MPYRDRNAKDHNHYIQISLLNNGIDYVLKGIDEMFSPDLELRDYVGPTDTTPTSFKYGVLHLYSGFLLLLKERLRRHGDTLFYQGSMKEVREKLNDGNEKKIKLLKTVDLDEALDRLEIGPRVKFDESELKTIRRMQDYRNLFEHFKVEGNKYELWSTISDFFS